PPPPSPLADLVHVHRAPPLLRRKVQPRPSPDERDVHGVLGHQHAFSPSLSTVTTTTTTTTTTPGSRPLHERRLPNRHHGLRVHDRQPANLDARRWTRDPRAQHQRPPAHAAQRLAVLVVDPVRRVGNRPLGLVEALPLFPLPSPSCFDTAEPGLVPVVVALPRPNPHPAPRPTPRPQIPPPRRPPAPVQGRQRPRLGVVHDPALVIAHPQHRLHRQSRRVDPHHRPRCVGPVLRERRPDVPAVVVEPAVMVPLLGDDPIRQPSPRPVKNHQMREPRSRATVGPVPPLAPRKPLGRDRVLPRRHPEPFGFLVFSPVPPARKRRRRRRRGAPGQPHDSLGLP
ncbi:hypothetical protein CSUB01_07860, partial [Colletotrichum sublineola]